MTLIKSISGVYGTIGGRPGDTLNPLEIVKLTSAFARFVSGKMIVVGRDGRMSGQMVRNIVVGTLMGMGCDVIDIGYASTPTTELAVRMTGADGGIVITASHNDSQWNGLKLLNHNGEFLMPHDSKEMLALAESEDFSYANIKQLGQLTINETFNQRHIDAVLHLKLVDADVDAIPMSMPSSRRSRNASLKTIALISARPTVLRLTSLTAGFICANPTLSL